MKSVVKVILLASFCCVVAACSDPQADKQRYLQNGDRLAAEKKYAEAIVEFRNAVSIDRNDGRARVKLADVLDKNGDMSGAFAEYVRAADLLPDDSRVQLRATEYLLAARQWEDAKSRVSRLLEREPKNIEGQVLLGTALAGLQDFDAAIGQIEEAIALAPDRGRSYASLAGVRFAKGDVAAARAAFQRAVEIDPKSVESWLALANFHLTTGATTEAESSLKRVLTLDRSHTLANRGLAALYMSTNRMSEAEPFVRAVADSTGGDAGRALLAEYYLRAGKREVARQAFRELVNSPRHGLVAEARLADIEYAGGQKSAAHQMLDRLIERSPQNSDLLVTKARWLLAEGKSQQALERATQAAASAPTSAFAHFVLGTVQSSVRDYAAATRSFNEVLRLNPTAAAAQLELSRLLVLQGDSRTAVQHASAALKSSPGNPIARVALARALIAQRDFPAAATEIQSLTKEYPSTAAIHALNGMLLATRKDLPGARQAYQRALDLDGQSLEAISGVVTVDLLTGNASRGRALVDKKVAEHPTNSDLMIVAARVYAADRDMAGAERHLRRAITLNPSNSDAYAMLAQALMAQRKLDEARKEFDEIVRRDPGSLGAATMAAMIVESQKNLPEAKKRYAEILARNGRASVAANNLAYIYAEEGTNLDEALRLAQSAVNVSPERAEIHDTLGWVYYKKELPLLAIAPFEQSIAKDAGNPLYHYHLALALAKAGETVKARRAAEAALQIKPDYAEARALLGTLKG